MKYLKLRLNLLTAVFVVVFFCLSLFPFMIFLILCFPYLVQKTFNKILNALGLISWLYGAVNYFDNKNTYENEI